MKTCVPIPSSHVKSQVWWPHLAILHSKTQGRDRQISGAHWPVGLAYLVKFQDHERLCLKEKVNNTWGMTPEVNFWPPHVCAKHTCTPPWTHTCTFFFLLMFVDWLPDLKEKPIAINFFFHPFPPDLGFPIVFHFHTVLTYNSLNLPLNHTFSGHLSMGVITPSHFFFFFFVPRMPYLVLCWLDSIPTEIKT